MRIFDWQELLDREHIEYVDRGPNVKRGELNIRCPFCASADPSHHMGLSLVTGWWACWRNQNHRGKSPVRLLVQLLRIPYWKAKQLAGLDDDYVDPEGFDAVAARLMSRDPKIQKIEEIRRDFLKFPADFDLITPNGRSRNHFRYLCDVRKFYDFTEQVINDYLLLCTTDGPFAFRIIIPYITNDELVSWTARAITKAEIRYKDLSLDECLIPPKENLFNHDCIIRGGHSLVVVEGPMDAIKIDFFGKAEGVRAVGLSTNSISDEQIYQLEEASSQFKQVVFMMDQKKSSLGAVDSMRMKARVASIRNSRIFAVPFGVKDAGDFTPEQAEDCCSIIRSMT